MRQQKGIFSGARVLYECCTAVEGSRKPQLNLNQEETHRGTAVGTGTPGRHEYLLPAQTDVIDRQSHNCGLKDKDLTESAVFSLTRELQAPAVDIASFDVVIIGSG